MHLNPCLLGTSGGYDIQHDGSGIEPPLGRHLQVHREGGRERDPGGGLPAAPAGTPARAARGQLRGQPAVL